MSSCTVVNLQAVAVSTYEIGVAVREASGKYAAGPDGLYAIGGNEDGSRLIIGILKTGRLLWGDVRRKLIDAVFVGANNCENGELTVSTHTGEYTYAVRRLSSCILKFLVGRGIRDSYLSIKIRLQGRERFSVDKIEVRSKASELRRT